MAREPLVVVLLKIPFRVAVEIKNVTSRVLGKSLNLFFTVLIATLQLFHFRSTVLQCFISGLLKLFLFSVSGYSFIYSIYAGILWTSLSGYPFLLIPLVLAEVISAVYLIKKSTREVPYDKRQALKNLILTGFHDIWALFLTLIAVVTIVGLVELRFDVNPEQYLDFTYKAIKFSIINILLIPKLFLLAVVPWRLVMFIMNYDPQRTGFADILVEICQGVFDVFSVICGLLVIAGVLEAKSMWKQYKKKTLTRKMVVMLVIKTVVDYILIILALTNLVLFVRAYAMINDFRESGKWKSQKEIGLAIWNSFLDTLLFPIRLFIYLFIVIGVYRLKNIKVSLASALSSSKGYRTFNTSCELEAFEQLIDTYFLLVFTVSLPFLHNSIPALMKLKTTKDWHKLAWDTLIKSLLDIPTFILLLFITVTVIRIPLFFRRMNMYLFDHKIKLCLDISSEILKDFLVIPFLIVNILTPWRYYYILPRLYRAVNPKEQRKILKADGLRPLEDYITIILCLILILSCWRTVEVLSIVVTHIRQVLNNEKLTSSLLRKIFRKFLELIIDIFMVAMILIIFLLLIEVPNFIRRMRVFYYLYRDRRGLQYKRYLESIWPSKQHHEPTHSSLRKLNRNVFTVVSSFLDVKSLATVSQVNKKFRDLTNFQPVWKFQYENQWKQHLDAASINEIALGDDYKELVKKAFDNYTKKNSGVILDEQERDYRMGARVIVLEEFILSIFGFPHIIALPAKIICYILSKIELDWYFANPRYPRSGFFILLGASNLDLCYTNICNDVRPSADSLQSFYHIQLNFVFYILRISLIVSEQIAFLLCMIDFAILRALSFGQYLQLNSPGTRPRNPTMPAVAYFIQGVATLLIVLGKLVLFLLPMFLSFKFTNNNWVWNVLGPFCVFLPYYFAFLCNLFTLSHYFEKFYNFNPQYFLLFIKQALTGASNFGIKLYNMLKPLFLRFRSVSFSFLKSLKMFIPKGTLFEAYKQILITAGGVLKTKGYLGDLIFTPLTLVWIFWPLLIPYFLNEFYLLIPIFPIEIFLIIKGYSTAKLAWDEIV